MEISVKSRNKWANSQAKYYWYDVLRFLLGLFLVYKGNSFISDSSEFEKIMASTDLLSNSSVSIQLISGLHIVGGILIIFGLLTRWAVLSQIPLLIGAISVNYLGDMNTTNLYTSAIALVLCIFFFWFGGGKHSADYFFKLGK
jgi:uncharacterized membrane protein YphA (DoxX/SURF4 family)